MKSFVPFLAVPVVVVGAYWLSPSLTHLVAVPPNPISVQQLALPPGAREVASAASVSTVSPLRLEALMPAFVVDHASPLPPDQRPAVERYHVASVLLSEEKKSAVINGEVLFEGSRLDEFRVQRIGKDTVVLKGPNGNETLALESVASRSLFVVSNKAGEGGHGHLSFVMPAANRPDAAFPLPPDELERQYRHLLENFSH
jgi:hypothetical protein